MGIFMEVSDKIFLISDNEDNKLINYFNDLIKSRSNIDLFHSSSTEDDLKANMQRDFYIIFIDYDNINRDVDELLDFIRNYLHFLPLVVVMSEDTSDLNHTALPYVVFMNTFNLNDLFFYQLVNTIDILKYNRNINDLTHLPGNFVVNDILNDKLKNKEDFALMYLDIDKFKSFTDYYGLIRANKLLTFLAELINSLVEEYGEMKDLIAHVGGDDFVIIFNDYRVAKVVGDKLIECFDSMMSEFYDDEDLQRGYISVLNRKGVYEDFPMVSLSVTFISNEFKEYSSTDEIYKEMMHIKHETKQFGGSILLQA